MPPCPPTPWSLSGSGLPGAPLTYFNDGGGVVPSDFFGSEILTKSDFFGCVKDAVIFLGHKRKQRDFFLGCEKRTKGFGGGGYAKKSSYFFGWTNSEVVIFFGIKYEPLSTPPPPLPPPPLLKFVSGAPRSGPCSWRLKLIF